LIGNTNAVPAATSGSGPPNNPTAVGNPCWLIEEEVAPGVAAFQIVTVAEVITSAFAVHIVPTKPRTADAKRKRFI
jgi:hypothetical protein